MINTMQSEGIKKLSLRQMKNLILTLILSSLFFITQAFAAGVKNLTGIKKDIKVISKVLESSTELDGSRSRVRVSGDYLAKQGIVLKVRFPGNSHFDFNFSEFGSFPSVSVAPDLFSSESDIEALVADSMEIAELAMLAPEAPEVPNVDFSFSTTDTKEKRALRDKQRELHDQQRELARKSRKLAQEARKNELKKQSKEFKKQKAELKLMQQKMKAQSKEMKQQMLSLRKKSREKRQKKLSTWTNNLLENFCSYAPYPRNLPRDEHLTLILSQASYANNQTQDRIIVLNNSQLTACRDGKLNGKELLAKSVNYSF